MRRRPQRGFQFLGRYEHGLAVAPDYYGQSGLFMLLDGLTGCGSHGPIDECAVAEYGLVVS
jgi:hypothetical protein